MVKSKFDAKDFLLRKGEVLAMGISGFILAVLLFSYAMRAVYIESCALFVRGGVYRIVKEALGGFWAKAAVSALSDS